MLKFIKILNLHKIIHSIYKFLNIKKMLSLVHKMLFSQTRELHQNPVSKFSPYPSSNI